MTRIVITGGSGFLGQNAASGLSRKHEVFTGYFSNLPSRVHGTPIAIDVTRSADFSRLLDNAQPDVVVHAAAMAQPDECERHPEQAKMLIVEGTRNVTRACREAGLRLIHISTDLVFDGGRGSYREGDPVAGTSVYSNAKIQAEKVVQELAPASTILRIALLYGQGSEAHPGHIELTLREWRAGRPVTFFIDQYRTPFFAPQVSDVIEALLERPRFQGLLHVGGGERVSRFTFAELLAERVKAPARLLLRGSIWDKKALAQRGADCSLVTEKLVRELSIRPLTCSEGLEQLAGSGYLNSLQFS